MKQPTLTELMALASVQVVTNPSNGSLLNPKDVGSGFLLHHKGEIFFVTVRHVFNKERKNKEGKHRVNALVNQTTSFSFHVAKVRFQLQISLHRCSDCHVESWKQSSQLLEM